MELSKSSNVESIEDEIEDEIEDFTPREDIRRAPVMECTKIQIHLDKRVPTGADLGGGSSNAATALWAANQFSGCIATEKELQEWSSEIRSDIPFFFSHGASYCTGRGEVVQNITQPLAVNTPMVLIKPQEACSTAEVYKRLKLDQTNKVDPLTLLEKVT